MFGQVTTRRHWVSGLMVAVLAMGLFTSSARADISQEAVNRAHRYLKTEKTGKEVLSFVHFGAAYRGHEYLKSVTVTDGSGRERPGYFALVYHYTWEDDGYTDVAFLCDENGSVYKTEIVKTNAGLQQPFFTANLTIKAVASIFEGVAGDNWTAKDRADFHQLVDAADSQGLLNLYLRLNQPSR